MKQFFLFNDLLNMIHNDDTHVLKKKSNDGIDHLHL